MAEKLSFRSRRGAERLPHVISRRLGVRIIMFAMQCDCHRADGLGLVFTDGDPFCGMDLDRCRDANGIIDAHARNLIARFASYTELSPSGAGVHMPTSVTTARYAHVRDWTASAASAGLLVRRASRRFSHARTGIAIRAPTVIPMPSPLASG
jgi:hypothetical protein